MLTGSYAALLASDLGTLLTGRVQDISVETLSFAELAAAKSEESPDTLFSRYLRIGGFPILHALDYDEDSAAAYTSTLTDAILMRDVVQRHSIRDPDALRRILAFAFDNIGSITSARKISDYWKSQRRAVSTDTTVNYLGYLRLFQNSGSFEKATLKSAIRRSGCNTNASNRKANFKSDRLLKLAHLCDSFLLRKVRRLDIRGKQHLEYSEKYYAGDIGLRRGLLGRRSGDIAGIVEKLVFLELVRRGWKISVGVVGDREIDFIVQRGDELRYYQVCVSLDSQSTIDREFSALEAVDDHRPKSVITLSPSPIPGRNGIPVLPLRDFLLGAE